MMNHFKLGFKQAIESIKRNKILFSVLIFLQFLFLIIFILNLVGYHLKILDSAQIIVDAMESADYSLETMGDNEMFLQEISGLLASYQELEKDVINLLLTSLGIFLLFNGTIWLGTHYLVHKENIKHIIKKAVKLVYSFIIITCSYSLIIYFFLIPRAMFEYKDVVPLIRDILLISAPFYYLLLISFTSLDISWKVFFKKMYHNGIKKAPYALSIILLTFLLLSGLFYISYNFLEERSSIFLILALILFPIILVISRIVLLCTLNKHENYNN